MLATLDEALIALLGTLRRQHHITLHRLSRLEERLGVQDRGGDDG